MKVDSLSSLQAAQNFAKKTEGSVDTQNKSFLNILDDAIQNVNQTEQESTADTIALLTGEGGDLHTSMIAMEKADIALQLATQIRNKILDAYNEIMRMQV